MDRGALMTDPSLTAAFEANRSHLRAVAYRMLGATGEADDAVQEAWLRAGRADTSEVRDLRAWLTTVTARVCLNVLRARRARPTDSLDTYVPDPIVSLDDGAADPERQALQADSVGLALLVVLETLSPAERLAFVLHDVFAVPFDDIAEMVDRSPAATRQLASRARRRVQGADAAPDVDVTRQRAVVDAFFAAARAGDFEGLLALLDPDVVARSDRGVGASELLRGAEVVARSAVTYANPAATLVPVLVNGEAGVAVLVDHRLLAVMGFTIRGGRVVEIDNLGDPDRLAALDLPALPA
jgi:RNA polymerase sigma-70 factor (ECF subfamily)